MEPLTQRQIQILKNIVEEYIKTADPVGSDNLDRKFSLGISPATIRNEMATLTSLGYLRQPHPSAGRIPSPRAMKFYVDQLMQEKQLSVSEEVAAKQKVLDARQDFDHLMQGATRALSQQTKSLCVGIAEEGGVWHSGYAHILENPEFYNIDVTMRVLSLLEEERRMREMFFGREWSEPVIVLFGEEMGWPHFEPVGIIACRFTAPRTNGTLAVIGSTRLNYPVIIPIVRYFSSLITQTTQA
ncbi:MAG: hypothetical protein A2782_04435 [Candidatus Blackburnbacteria bacterium RIFCSPHIGHO2_01_FULL_43_15b]|uniref:Heat-inducible transcription repressor HrcA n=1 Tax=Candidatus Blackburnbacteria bacterium RIFCSPHIGHO2_01_FULL_43_15b TaxID=1797513 RepID=A0A1G1V3G9_9BACT|nr:MAG: hypothetical protein A2782_04435 [Candidatus Blackburnbacteria bacterium RIFCSPHIGHO2_01_FULL_43_15b]